MTMTTTTSAVELVPAEMISDVIIAKAIDKMVVAPLALEVDQGEAHGLVHNFPQLDKDVGADITVEGTTDVTMEELTFTETSVTIAQVAIGRHTTKLVERSNRLGAAGFLSLMVADAASLLAEMIDDDLCALFASFTASWGTTTIDLTVADMLVAIGKQRTGKAFGDVNFILDDQAALDLTVDVGSSTASIFNGTANQGVLNARVDGFLGPFLQAPVWYTNLTDTANAGADVVSACIVNGRSTPEHASLGLVTLWAGEMDEITDVDKIARKRAFSSAYGVGLISQYGSKGITDA